MGWTEEMKEELKKIFDEEVKKEGWCSSDEIKSIATRTGEDPEELEDHIDLLEFDEQTLLLSWELFFEWWSQEVDPRSLENPKSQKL